jgi:gliding motility-associated transport system ATP-binding protein
MPIIEVHKASKTFDHVTALDQLSGTVEAGEVVGLLGPNGSGKTTLIRLLCAYFPPTSGSVCVAGYDTRVAPLEVRRHVGYALEGVVLYPDLTVSDFLSFVRTVKKASELQLDAVISQCGLEGWLHRRIGTLSKGYRQRVVLAQALLGDPPVLILDEPTSGMDPEMAVKIRGLIKTLAGSRTVLLSTHSLPEASLICQRVLVLYQGRLLAQGTPQELFPGQTAASTLEDVFLRLAASPTVNSQQSALSN